MTFNIQHCSTHDGPGICMVTFLKGCSLDCRQCQNLEDRTRMQDLPYDPRLCLKSCELCAKTAPEVIECVLNGLLIHREKLTPEHFTTLTGRCPIQALTVCGGVKSIEEIMTAALCDKPFYDHSDGGLTFSGDEPFMQPEMATVLLQASREAGIHIAIETCLHVLWRYIASSLPYIDLLLANLEHVASAPFKQWIDGNAVRMSDGLKKLAAAGKRIIIRVLLIQGSNANEISTKAITDFAAGELHVGEIHFLPYHTLGISRYRLLNLPYDTPEKPFDAPELLDFTQQYACQKGLIVTLRG